MVLRPPLSMSRIHMQGIAALFVAVAAASSASAQRDLVALRVKRAETIVQGRIEHAVILVENGKIVTIGADLPIDRGIPIVDLREWTVMPGLVSCSSRIGMDSQAGSGSEPQLLASAELYPREEDYAELLELGVTTLGLYPAGTGIPGQAVAVRPHGATVDEMIVRDHAYLKIDLFSNAGSKKMLRDGFDKVDKFEEKEKTRREKWDKEQEKKKKKDKPKKDDAKKDDAKKEEEEKKDEAESDVSEAYVPETPDADVVPFLQLRSGELSALIHIDRASDYLHLVDAIDDEEFRWNVRVDLRDDIDLYEVTEPMGKRGLRVVVEPELTLFPGTRRERNLPRELADAGAKVTFVPRSDSVRGHESWRVDVGQIVAAGFDRAAALRAMTLEPAEVLDLAERVGSLEPGKDANLLFLDGDPLGATTRVKAVMLEGRFVFGEVN